MISNIRWVLINQFGFNPKKMLRGFLNLNKFYKDYKKYKENYKGKINIQPCLHDWYESAGDISSEYFIQDLHVAQLILNEDPIKHVDVGSRIDGFVANIASSREIEIFDIRTINKTFKNIVYRQCDIIIGDSKYINYTKSLSCLHSLEHFGLGRYGDPINPNGYISSFENLTKMLQLDGLFYLSVPLGLELVEFNANRIFSLTTIMKLANDNSLIIENLYTISNGVLSELTYTKEVETQINKLSYILGIFVFRKK
jgi:hypothetical protein